MIKEHYEKLYTEAKNAFGGEKGEPARFVTKVLDYLHHGDVLDVGAGQGRNSLWLAQHGFKVDAIELSEKGVEDIQTAAQEREVSIRVNRGDIRDGLEGMYDVVVSTYMTHHLAKEEALQVIADMKEHTRIGGLNVLEVFTKEGDFFNKSPHTDRYYPALGELKSLYQDWEIIEYEERDGEARATWPDGRRMRNVAARIIARRKS